MATKDTLIDTKPKPRPDGADVTYIPRKDDPAEVTWNNHLFKANVPRPVKNPIMIEQAKGNPWFAVAGHERGTISESKVPASAEDYRAHAVAWINEAKTSFEMTERWEAEEPLRHALGVGTDDFEWINKFYDPKIEQLRKAEIG